MSNIINIEKPIFLHFLNREASSAIGSFLPERDDIATIDVLLLCHSSNLTVNISQMIEYSDDKLNLVQYLSELTTAGILITTSHDTNMEEFIASREKLYHSVSHKYGMYFRDTSKLLKFTIKQNNNFSMTRLLRQDILDFDPDQFTFTAPRARLQDISKFRKHLKPFQRVAFHEKDQAITRANFEIFLNQNEVPKNALDSSARIFSALYVEHYATNNAAVTPTGLGFIGFVEDYEYFPHYDVPTLSGLLATLGWQELRSAHPHIRQQMIEVYGNGEHRVFVETVNAFICACFEQVKPLLNSPLSGDGAMATVRAMILNLGSILIRQALDETVSKPKNLLDFFAHASDTISRAARANSTKDRFFQEAWENNMLVKRKVRVLFLTATDTADDAICDGLQNAGYHNDGTLVAGQGYAEKYVHTPSKEIILVRSSAGSIGSSGSELVSSDAIKELDPDFLIAVGICFGLRDDEHRIGDILVAEYVCDYEMVREGENELRERGPRIPASPKLISAARLIRSQYSTSTTNVWIGLLLSGLKLLDSKSKREHLKTRFPDALGGEMEASGIMGAATRQKGDWIVINAICDWAFDKGKENQKLAATNASLFAIKLAEYVMNAEIRT